MSKESESDAKNPEFREIDEDLPSLGPRTVSADRLRPVKRRKKEHTDEETNGEAPESGGEESEDPTSRDRQRTPRGKAFADPLADRQPAPDMIDAEINDLADTSSVGIQEPSATNAPPDNDPDPADHLGKAPRVFVSGSDGSPGDSTPLDREAHSEDAAPGSAPAADQDNSEKSLETVEEALPPPHPGTDAAATDSHESTRLGRLDSSERKSLLVFAAGVIVVALVAFYFLRGALPIGVDRPALAERFPASGDMFLVKSEGLGWARVDSARERVRLGVEYVPQLNLRVEGSATGALRVVFLNELGRQRGDTVTVNVRNGAVAGAEEGILRILGTDGLANTLEYNDLRAQPELSWSVEIREGTDAQADGRAFRPILRAPIPRDLIAP